MQTPAEELKKNKNNQEWRIQAGRNNLGSFISLYLNHYIKEASPPFHYDIFRTLMDDEVKFVELIAFRGSGKSFITSVAYAIHQAVYKKRHFIILCSDTFTQAKMMIANIIHEFESNDLLKTDFGPFKGDDEWTATNIVLENEVRIMSRSRGQQVRGLRHYQNRPDLIVCDDVENIEDVRTIEQRNKTEEWFLSDVMPAIEPSSGKLVLDGNLLHSDSLISRTREKIIDSGVGEVHLYPLIGEDGENVWVERFNDKIIGELKLRPKYFMREYLLKLVPDEGQIVKRVGYYNQLPELQRIAIGVDLAISKKQTADYTAINVAGEGVDGKIYNIKNKYDRWNFNEAIENIYLIYCEYQKLYPNLSIMLGIEDVAFQRAAIEEFYRRYKIQPTPIPQTKDKKARIETFLPYLENDQILFRREGMEDLIIQLLNIGIEAHDDCIDSAEISWRLIVNIEKPNILWI